MVLVKRMVWTLPTVLASSLAAANPLPAVACKAVVEASCKAGRACAEQSPLSLTIDVPGGTVTAGGHPSKILRTKDASRESQHIFVEFSEGQLWLAAQKNAANEKTTWEGTALASLSGSKKGESYHLYCSPILTTAIRG